MNHLLIWMEQLIWMDQLIWTSSFFFFLLNTLKNSLSVGRDLTTSIRNPLSAVNSSIVIDQDSEVDAFINHYPFKNEKFNCERFVGIFNQSNISV